MSAAAKPSIPCALCGSPVATPELPPKGQTARLQCAVCRTVLILDADGKAVEESVAKRQPAGKAPVPVKAGSPLAAARSGAPTMSLPRAELPPDPIPPPAKAPTVKPAVKGVTLKPAPTSRVSPAPPTPENPFAADNAPTVVTKLPFGATPEARAAALAQATAEADAAAATRAPAPVETSTSAPAAPIPFGRTRAERRHTAFGAPAFEGDLDKLSIVDVLQLLHISKRTGRLTVDNGTAHGRLMLKNGHIVGGEHPDDKVATGRIVVEQGLAAQADVEQALSQQQSAGDRRRPLIATLVQMGKLEEAAGFKALTKLVELTILEVLGWKTGTFLFEVADVATSDSFQHLPPGVLPAIDIDTQRILMDSVRILDEQNRPGGAPVGDDDLLDFDAFDAPQTAPGAPASAEADLGERAPTQSVPRLDQEAPEATAPVGVATRAYLLKARVATLWAEPRHRLIALSVGAAVVFTVAIAALALWSSSRNDAADATATTTTPARPAPAPPEPSAAPDTSPTAAAAAPTPGADPDLSPVDPLESVKAAAPEEGPATDGKAKHVKGKRVKAKAKAKDARSLFDAAIK